MNQEQAVSELRAAGKGAKSLAWAYAGLEVRDSALAVIDSIVGEYLAEPDPWNRRLPFEEMAVVQVLLGEKDRAIDILEEMLGGVYYLTTYDLRLNPTWDPLRDHPRFLALLEEHGDDAEH